MALIKCPECGNEVSTLATACPKCGAPIASRSVQTPVTTVEATSKQLKAQGCLSAIVIGLGVVVLIAASSSQNPSPIAIVLAVILLLTGGIWAVVTRLRVWWHHE